MVCHGQSLFVRKERAGENWEDGLMDTPQDSKRRKWAGWAL